MGLELVTGYWGVKHVTAEQHADRQAGIVGAGCYVFPIGERMRAEAVTSNIVRIFDGTGMAYGRQFHIGEGEYENVTIENGTAGMLRNDFIILKYKKDEASGVEGMTFEVLKGSSAETAVDPTPNDVDIRTGVFESEIPLYRVRLNGLAIEAIEPLYTVLSTKEELMNKCVELEKGLSELNSKSGGLRYENLSYTGVTETYASGNSLKFGGKNLNVANYPNSAYFVLLTSLQSLAKVTAYIVLLGTESDASNVSLIRIDTNSGTVPTLTKLTGGGAGVIWSASATAKIRAHIFKLC